MPPKNSSIYEELGENEEAFFEQDAANNAEPNELRDEHAGAVDQGTPGAEGVAEDAATPPVDDSDKGQEDAGKKEGEEGVGDKTAKERDNYKRAMNEERDKRRAMEQQIAEMRQQMQTLESLREQLQALRESAKAQPEVDDFDADPIGALRKEVDSIKSKEMAREELTKKATTEQEEFRSFQSRVAEAVREFETEEAPDYKEALAFLVDARARELSLFGLPEEQIAHALTNESIGIARFAEQHGKNPARIVYEMAKARGYAKAAAATEKQPKDTLDAKIDKIDKGQREVQSMSGAGGGKKATGSLSLSDIEKMSDADFDAMWQEMEASAYGR